MARPRTRTSLNLGRVLPVGTRYEDWYLVPLVLVDRDDRMWLGVHARIIIRSRGRRDSSIAGRHWQWVWITGIHLLFASLVETKKATTTIPKESFTNCIARFYWSDIVYCGNESNDDICAGESFLGCIFKSMTKPGFSFLVLKTTASQQFWQGYNIQ